MHKYIIYVHIYRIYLFKNIKKWTKQFKKAHTFLLDNPTRKCRWTVCTSCFTFRWKVFQTAFQFRLIWSRKTSGVLFIFAHIFCYSSFILCFFHFGSSFVVFIEMNRFARIFSFLRVFCCVLLAKIPHSIYKRVVQR